MLDAGEVAARWPQFELAEDVMALYQRDAAIVPAGLGTRTLQEQATKLGADLRPHCPVTGVEDLGERRDRGRDRRRHDPLPAGSWSARTPGSTTCSDTSACDCRSR